MVFASPDPRARAQPRLRTTVSASPDPRARAQPRLRKTDSDSPDPRARTQPRPPDDGLCLARPPGSDSTSTSTSEEPPPRSGRPRHKGGIITLPLASPGYGEQDRRPIWLAPVKQVMMAPRVLHDNDGSQPLTEARRRQQGSDSPDSCASTGLKRSSDGHDAT
jgi:hypothetical protein